MRISERTNSSGEAIVVLKNGNELRKWTEHQILQVNPSVIRCTTYVVRRLGLRWLAGLSNERKIEVRVLCDSGQANVEIAPIVDKLFTTNELEIRVIPTRQGIHTDNSGLFHPKSILLDDTVAIIGSANLTGKALELGPKPYNIELSVGLSGPTTVQTIVKLVKHFETWWDKASPLILKPHNTKREKLILPEYIVFKNRPNWGIAEVQTEGSGLFGEEQWLAVSEILPTDPERRHARIRVPDKFVESQNPEPWETPASQLASANLSVIKSSKQHFRRLAACWLMAENRQGQLDSLPVLELRHQTSLVEFLSGTDAPRKVLIADEVGLGKTVELGMLLARLRAANPELRILYVTQGGLVTNVIEEFINMGFDADQIFVFANTSLDEKNYPPARLGKKEHDAWVVASLHRLGNRRNADSILKDTEWDVVIADECHRLRMYGSKESSKAQKWFRVVETIVSKHLSKTGRVYFLSGTPHQGNREVFLNLVAMMCGLDRQASQQEKEQELAGRVIYRTKEEIRDWEERPVFPKRDVKEPTYATTPTDYNELLEHIAEYFEWLQTKEKEKKGKQQRALGFVKSHALQYAASSPKAGFAFLLRRLIRYFGDEVEEKKLLHWVELLIPYRQWSANQKPKNLLKELCKSVQENNNKTEDFESGSFVGPKSPKQTRGEEKSRLAGLLNKYAKLLSKPEAKSKFDALMNLLLSYDEPFVVFAQSVDTVYEVKRYVESYDIPCCLIVGGQDPHKRREMIDEFKKPGRLGRRVLVSSSAGGEGINLQISRQLIHFDLPWNPMVLEQRIGRVHRIGTIDTVIVNTILLEGSREADIYVRLMERLFKIVSNLTNNERQQAQYFRRILSGIPLDQLRELYGGSDADQNKAIGDAVAAGQRHVERVDKELHKHRVEELPEDRGLATMEHLIELLELSGKIVRTNQKIKFNKVVFDDNSNSFKGVEEFATRFNINDGRSKDSEKWVVFDREVAVHAPSVERENSGGIDHPIVSLAIQSMKTPKNIDDFKSLTLGVGVFDREYLEYFANGRLEPVIILSYISARLSGYYYFDHDLHVFALSPLNSTVEKIERRDSELIEKIIWDNVKYDGPRLTCPALKPEFIERLVDEDARIRQELKLGLQDENGHWIGAVWPIAATVLKPN